MTPCTVPFLHAHWPDQQTVTDWGGEEPSMLDCPSLASFLFTTESLLPSPSQEKEEKEEEEEEGCVDSKEGAMREKNLGG